VELGPKTQENRNLLEAYCFEAEKEPRAALRTLIAAVLALVPESAGAAEDRVPPWLDRLLSHATVDARNIIQSLCIVKHNSWCGPVSRWAFENTCVQCHEMISDSEVDEDEGILPVFQKDDDGQMLRIIAWLFSFGQQP
jgi:hypothetical protein